MEKERCQTIEGSEIEYVYMKAYQTQTVCDYVMPGESYLWPWKAARSRCATFLVLAIDVGDILVEKLLQHAVMTMVGLRGEGEWFGRRGREESVTRCGECLLIETHLSEHIRLNDGVVFLSMATADKLSSGV